MVGYGIFMSFCFDMFNLIYLFLSGLEGFGSLSWWVICNINDVTSKTKPNDFGEDLELIFTTNRGTLSLGCVCNNKRIV